MFLFDILCLSGVKNAIVAYHHIKSLAHISFVIDRRRLYSRKRESKRVSKGMMGFRERRNENKLVLELIRHTGLHCVSKNAPTLKRYSSKL